MVQIICGHDWIWVCLGTVSSVKIEEFIWVALVSKDATKRCCVDNPFVLNVDLREVTDQLDLCAFTRGTLHNARDLHSMMFWVARHKCDCAVCTCNRFELHEKVGFTQNADVARIFEK